MRNITESDYVWYIRLIGGTLKEVEEGETVHCGQNWTRITQLDGTVAVIPNIQIAEVILTPKNTANTEDL